jgi:hypothetical protein
MMGAIQRLCYLAVAGFWAYCVHQFFAESGKTPPHLQGQIALYTAIAHLPSVLLVAVGLTSRHTTHGLWIRGVALFGVLAFLGLIGFAAVLGVSYFLIGGTLPARVVTPMLWGGAGLVLASLMLLVDAVRRLWKHV